MLISFSYPSGRSVVAAVLAVGADFIRVVSPRRIDGFDIYLRDQEWVTEMGKTIRVDAILLGDGTQFPSAVAPRWGHSKRQEIKVAVGGAVGS